MLGIPRSEGLCSCRGCDCTLKYPLHFYDQRRWLCIKMYRRALALCPEFARLMYSVLATDPPGVYTVLTANLSKPLPQGAVFRVNTGGPIPPRADAVIMVEDTIVKTTHRDKKGVDFEEAEIETLAQIPKGENIRPPGSDVRAGDLVFSKGTILDGLGGDIGTLAFVGKKDVCPSL